MEGRQRHNPAVYAGLMAATLMLSPQTAQARSLTETIFAAGPLPFLAGALAGGLATTLACALVMRHEADDVDDGSAAVGATAVPWAPDATPASHVALDYEDIAENYVRHGSWQEKLAARARGVRDVLAERLGTDRFEGLPIIERADGSVGDVGTSWWNARLSQSVRAVGDLDARVPPIDALEVPSWMEGMSRPATSKQASATPRPSARARSRAAIIARSVAEVDQGVYPERRSAVDLDHKDVWEEALAAMSERIEQAQAAPVFVAAASESDASSASERMAQPTRFIPFKAPAGHPEVVDTETYVDYLISEEFSRNSSQAARRSSRNYLHVIEGGSQAIKSTASLKVKRGRDPKEPYRPKHMAPPLDLREARQA